MNYNKKTIMDVDVAGKKIWQRIMIMPVLSIKTGSICTCIWCLIL